MYHYVYKLVHIETSEFYIGSRSCECHPSVDSYLGSMQTWKPDKNKLIKVILEDDFNSREEAMIFERESILSNLKNSLNMNFNIPGENFHTLGMVHVKDKEGNCLLQIEPIRTVITIHNTEEEGILQYNDSDDKEIYVIKCLE